MACFLVPAAFAVVTTILQRCISEEMARRLRLGLLNTMLWGGVILLAVEHIWHGEVVPWPPFLTAMENPEEVPVMLHEMAVIGSAMVVTIVAVWTVAIKLASFIESRKPIAVSA